MSPTTAGFAELKDTYVNVQLRGDRGEALHFIDRLVNEGHSVSDIQQHVIAAARREIGRMWEESRIGTAQEHMAGGAFGKAGVGVAPPQASRS